MMAGLQGAGKTTTTAKIAAKLKAKGQEASCLQPVMYIVLQRSNSCRSTERKSVSRYSPWEIRQNPVDIAKAAVEHAPRIMVMNVVILDTAGRLHVDEDMMEELEEIKAAVDVYQTILVVDAMTGQDAVNVSGYL